MSDFKFFIPVQLRFSDVDSMQHVNNARYLTFLEMGRIHYFKDVIGENIDWLKEGIILAKASIDFKNPILITDNVEVGLRVSRIGNKSFDISGTIIKREGDKIIEMASALTVMVCFDYHEQKSVPVPQKWVEKIKKFEGYED